MPSSVPEETTGGLVLDILDNNSGTKDAQNAVMSVPSISTIPTATAVVGEIKRSRTIGSSIDDMHDIEEVKRLYRELQGEFYALQEKKDETDMTMATQQAEYQHELTESRKQLELQLTFKDRELQNVQRISSRAQAELDTERSKHKKRQRSSLSSPSSSLSSSLPLSISSTPQHKNDNMDDRYQKDRETQHVEDKDKHSMEVEAEKGRSSASILKRDERTKDVSLNLNTGNGSSDQTAANVVNIPTELYNLAAVELVCSSIRGVSLTNKKQYASVWQQREISALSQLLLSKFHRHTETLLQWRPTFAHNHGEDLLNDDGLHVSEHVADSDGCSMMHDNVSDATSKSMAGMKVCLIFVP